MRNIKKDVTGVYSNTQIETAIASGHIVCYPYNRLHLNGSSLDLTLGENYYRTGRDRSSRFYNPFDKTAVQKYFGTPQKATLHHEWLKENGIRLFKNIPPDHPIIVLEPGERILAHTEEFVGIRPPGTSSIQARSTWGRNGVSVCFDAGWGDPGYINRWTLEIYNLNKHHYVVLPVGERIAQIIFMHTGLVEGDYTVLSGKYQSSNNLKPLVRNWQPEQMLPKSYNDSRLKPSNNQKRGRYIVLEGSDGTGKTTQASLLYYRLATAGVPMCGFMLAEPGGLYRLDSPEDALAFPNWKPEIYEERCLDPSARAISCLIKDKSYTFDPQTRLLLHTAAHRAAWQKATQKALAQGLTVIATRNWLSALVYQGYGDGVDKKVIETVTRDLVSKEYLDPDVTLVLMYDNEQERFQRIHDRGEEMSIHEEKTDDFHRRVNAGYRTAVEQYDIQAVDADASVDDVHERIWQHVAPLFGLMNQRFPIYHQPVNSTTDKIARFIRGGGTRKLYVVLDFDRTLAQLSTYDILQRHLPGVGQRQYATLYEHYRSRDASGSLSADEAALWTSSILDLLAYFRVNLVDIEADILDQAPIQPQVAEFFAICNELDIPTVIVSGGVQNVIDIWCKSHGISPTLVLANKLIVNKEGCVTGWNKDTLTHPLNKHETNHPDLTAITFDRPYAILVGDNLNDWNMAQGDDTVLRIFVHSSPLDSETEQAALKRFDIVLGADAFNRVSQMIEDIRNAT